MTNTALLKKRIEESGLKHKYIADKIGITVQSLGNKVSGRNEFKVSEMLIICDLLMITGRDRDIIFLGMK